MTEGDDWWNSSGSEANFDTAKINLEYGKDKHRSKPHRKREVGFNELIERIKEVIFKRNSNFEDKIGEVIKSCVEWLILIVVENVAEWPFLKKVLEYFNI